MARSNGLAFSCAAPIDRESCRAESCLQNRYDLGAAQRRQLKRHVRWQLGIMFTSDPVPPGAAANPVEGRRFG